MNSGDNHTPVFGISLPEKGVNARLPVLQWTEGWDCTK